MEPGGIELHPLLGSSRIARWGWSVTTTARERREGRGEFGILALEFTAGGIWHYLDVPQAVFEDFLLADSKGRFVHDRIVWEYAAKRVDEPLD